MIEKYEIKHWQDNIYAVYRKDDPNSQQIFTGDLEEINAWLSLREKGFEI